MKEYGAAVREILSENGWEFLRHAKGDHVIWWHPESGRKVTLDSKMKARHLANAVLKQAGVGKRL